MAKKKNKSRSITVVSDYSPAIESYILDYIFLSKIERILIVQDEEGELSTRYVACSCEGSREVYDFSFDVEDIDNLNDDDRHIISPINQNCLDTAPDFFEMNYKDRHSLIAEGLYTMKCNFIHWGFKMVQKNDGTVVSIDTYFKEIEQRIIQDE